MTAMVAAESAAMAALVHLGADPGEGAIWNARKLCADALNIWRRAGDRARAKWLRYHISLVCYPFRPRQFTPQAMQNSHDAWLWRYNRKYGTTNK